MFADYTSQVLLDIIYFIPPMPFTLRRGKKYKNKEYKGNIKESHQKSGPEEDEPPAYAPCPLRRSSPPDKLGVSLWYWTGTKRAQRAGFRVQCERGLCLIPHQCSLGKNTVGANYDVGKAGSVSVSVSYLSPPNLSPSCSNLFSASC